MNGYELVSGPEQVPAGKICKVIDALNRGPDGALVIASRNACGLDAPYMSGTDLRAEFAAFLDSEECAELRRRAALAGCVLVFGLRDRHDPAAVEHSRLRRLHRATFGDF